MLLDYLPTFQPKKCGFYYIRHIIGLRENQQPQQIPVPLISSEYTIEIANTIANVTLEQTYLNPTDKYIQVEYNFPINPKICVYRFVATFGDSRIQGVVKERQQAKKQYFEAIQEGKQAAYGQIDSQSKDILNLKIGNIGPKQQVKVELIFMQQLTLSYNMFYQFQMLGTIWPRFLDSIPKESIFKGLRNKQAKAKGQFYWNFKVILKTSNKVSFFDSSSHDIQLVSQNDTQTESIFQMSKSCVPNKDFVFTFSTENYHLPNYIFGRTDISSSAMLSFIPKFCDLNIDDAYKASINGTPYETDIDNVKGDYIFFIDRSGSMKGDKMEKAKQALILFIKSLPQDSFFNVISFGNQSKQLFPTSVRYSDKQVGKAVTQIKRMTANMGGTVIFKPLQVELMAKPIKGYPKQIFLLTDGAVSDTQQVINLVSRSNKFSRVHTIGIGNGCSQSLIIGCSEKGKGHHVFIKNDENPSQKIIQLLSDSLSPVISKMKLTYDKSVIESIIPNPQSLPYILKGELVNFHITFKGQLDKKTLITFEYEDSQNKLPYSSNMQIDPESSNQSFIDKMGQFKKIRLLEESYKVNNNVEQLMYCAKIIDKKAEIIKQSVRHQILSAFTAFICVQKQLIDGKYQEIKNTGQLNVKILNPKPIQNISKNKNIMVNNYAKKMSNIAPNSNLNKLSISSSSSIRQEDCLKMKCSKPRNSAHNILKQQQRFQLDYRCAKQPRDIRKKITQKNAYFNHPQKQTRTLQKKCMPKQDMIKFTNQLAISIQEIISQQTAQGCWKDIKLIDQLGIKLDPKLIYDQLEAVITFLVVKWIEKYYPEKQYALVIKKGYNFIKKLGMNQQKYQQQFNYLVK